MLRSVFAAEVFPEVRSFRSEVTSLARVLVASVDSWAAMSVLSLARSDFAPEMSPKAKALSSVTISCVRVSSALLVLVLLATVDDVLTATVALVVAVFFVLAAMDSSACSRSDADEMADTDKTVLPSVM